ncbi:hypothetical protein [Methylobacterium sp. 88A]|uniref:hypothetical protein n=1 Tax=Methylobacterium sp. 88A TaxID=1131813 RepID=UPI000370CCDE|nr:hypothetical protein [Methylobacterium sp. 88A]
MSYVEKRCVWVKGRHRLHVHASKQIGRLIKKHKASSTAEETLKVLLDAVVSWIVLDVESEYDMAIYLERLAHRLREDAARADG